MYKFGLAKYKKSKMKERPKGMECSLIANKVFHLLLNDKLNSSSQEAHKKDAITKSL